VCVRVSVIGLIRQVLKGRYQHLQAAYETYRDMHRITLQVNTQSYLAYTVTYGTILISAAYINLSCLYTPT
jgi:hypothetical protein